MWGNFTYLRLFTAIILCAAMDLSIVLAASEFGPQPWTNLETTYTIIQYKSEADLQRFHEQVDFGPGAWNKSSTFSTIPQSEINKNAGAES